MLKLCVQLQKSCNKAPIVAHTMQNRLMPGKVICNRRQFLKLGLTGVGVAGVAVAVQNFKPQMPPPLAGDLPSWA